MFWRETKITYILIVCKWQLHKTTFSRWTAALKNHVCASFFHTNSRSFSRVAGLEEISNEGNKVILYLATSFTFVGTFSRTRYNTIGTFVIQWYAKKWPGILKFSQVKKYIYNSLGIKLHFSRNSSASKHIKSTPIIADDLGTAVLCP